MTALDRAALDAVLAQATQPGGLPGLTAAVATREGAIYVGAAGLRSIDGEAPMTPDTVFGMASMTKAITCVAAMRLVERGVLSLDEPALEVLAEIGSAQVLDGFADDGAPVLRPPRVAVTLRHLLTHTSGFVYDFSNADLFRYLQTTGLPATRTCDRSSLKAPMLFDPGSRWEYGTGIDWVGLMIEAATGTRLDRHLRDEILGPLRMADTAFAPDDEQLSRRASVHRREADGTLRATPLQALPAFGYYPGGSRIFSTAPDYLRFLRMLLGGGELDGARLLRPETVIEMSRNQIGMLDVRPLPAVLPEMTGAFDLLPGVACKWGLASLINAEALAGRRSAGGLAWAGIANTYFWVDPASGVVGLLLAQVSPFLDPAVLAALAAFETAVYRAPL